MSLIYNILSKFDIFDYPVLLTINKEQSYKSAAGIFFNWCYIYKIGGFISICVIIFFLTFLHDKITNFSQHNVIKIQENMNY